MENCCFDIFEKGKNVRMNIGAGAGDSIQNMKLDYFLGVYNFVVFRYRE